MQPAYTNLTPPRSDRLAIVFQELLTVIVRVRADRQPIQQVDHFRNQVRNALLAAQEEAVRAGYARDQAFRAAQAVTAFLDETVLNSPNAAYRDWARQPLGPEFFQQHVAGEVFFLNIRDLLGGEDSEQAADLLEVYLQCLLLGYRGRFGGREGDVRAITDRIMEKIARIRGASPWLVPYWMPAGETAPRESNIWNRRLQWIAVGSAGLLVLSLAVYFLLLRSSVASITASTGVTQPGIFAC
ncbi:MAG: DotU family type IV/VI secretion system protein [Bryobacteraceae bacterium]